MARKRAGIKDVAERAGVSWKTVSNVVNDRPVVRPETREKVLAAIEELGYIPNAAGRQLRQGSSRTVALVLPELRNPYFARLAQLFQLEGVRRGRVVSIELMDHDPGLERRYLEGSHARDFEAVVVSPTQLAVSQVRRGSNRAPLVLLGERAADGAVPHVMIDNVASAIDIMKHLVDTGRRRIGFLGASSETGESTGSRRFDGYRIALRFAGIDTGDELVRPGRIWDRTEGFELATSLLTDGVSFDALVCANDLLAIGAAAALAKAGVSVPRDVALASWDDIDEARWATPPLTSVAPDMDQLVRTAFDAALADNPADVGGPEFTIGHKLVIRESSSPATAATRTPAP